MAQAAFDHTVAHLSTRHAFGKPVAANQHWQFLLAERATEIENARDPLHQGRPAAGRRQPVPGARGRDGEVLRHQAVGGHGARRGPGFRRPRLRRANWAPTTAPAPSRRSTGTARSARSTRAPTRSRSGSSPARSSAGTSSADGTQRIAPSRDEPPRQPGRRESLAARARRPQGFLVRWTRPYAQLTMGGINDVRGSAGTGDSGRTHHLPAGQTRAGGIQDRRGRHRRYRPARAPLQRPAGFGRQRRHAAAGTRLVPAHRPGDDGDESGRPGAGRIRRAETDPQDRRRYAVDITDDGRKVLASLNRTLVDLDGEILTDLGTTERSRFTSCWAVSREVPL